MSAVIPRGPATRGSFMIVQCNFGETAESVISRSFRRARPIDKSELSAAKNGFPNGQRPNGTSALSLKNLTSPHLRFRNINRFTVDDQTRPSNKKSK